MTQPRHTVRKGDTLWAISGAYLGDPYQWPRIWRYNNRPEVIRATGKAIPNPDLIYPGQTLLIPVLPGNRATAQSPASSSPSRPNKSGESAGGGDLNRQLSALTEVATYTFHLPDVKLPPIIGPNFIAVIKMTGKVVMSRDTGEPLVNLSSRGGISFKSQTSASHAFGQLVAENKVELNLAKGEIKFASKMISQSNLPYAPSQSFGAGISSTTGLPNIRTEFSYPSLTGNIAGWNFKGMNVTYVIEVTPKGNNGGNPQGLEGTEPFPINESDPPIVVNSGSSSLAKTVGGVLVVAAGVVIVATIVEDFLTMGAGVADDPASFAFAGGLFTGGRALWAGRAVLPSFKSVITFGGSLTIIGAPATAAANQNKTKVDETNK